MAKLYQKLIFMGHEMASNFQYTTTLINMFLTKVSLASLK